jgi:glycosyltransferase involved in cell wall biosynthesis
MAAGLPVVTTTIGNEGIDAKPGKDLLIADTADDFARNVLRLMKDRKLREILSENGRAFVHERFDWDKIVQQTENDYQGLRA